MTQKPLPPLPLVDGCLFIDNSGFVETTNTCYRKYEYAQLRKRILAGEQPALSFGGAIHTALEYRYVKAQNQRCEPWIDDEVAAILTDVFAEHPTPEGDWRTLNWAVELFRRYTAKYSIEEFSLLKYDKPVACPYCKGTGCLNGKTELTAKCAWCEGFGKRDLMVELSFALPLFTYHHADDSQLRHGNIPIIYTGRIDLPVSLDGRLFILDHKTSGFLGPAFFDRGMMSTQQRGYCFSGDTELLTKHGWVRIDSLPKNLEVAQWDNGLIQFVKPTEYFEKEASSLINYRNGLDLNITPEHRILVKDRQSLRYKEYSADCLPLNHNLKVPVTGFYTGSSKISDNVLRFCAMLQADGHITPFKGARFHFSLPRKIQRCRWLLQTIKVQFTESLQTDNTTVFHVPNSSTLLQECITLLTLSKKWGGWLLQASGPQLEMFIEEVKEWDGHDRKNKGFIYSTSSYENASWIQTIAALVKRRATIHTQNQEGNIQFRVNVTYTTEIGTGQFVKETKVWNKAVYCVNVPSSYLLTRRNNLISVAGNCWAFRELTGQMPAGYIINGIRSKEPPQYVTSGNFNGNRKSQSPDAWWAESFQRERYYVDAAKLDEWKFNTIDKIEEMFWHYSRGYLPTNPESCTKYNMRCPFFQCCELEESDRLVMLSSGAYTENTWTPLKMP